MRDVYSNESIMMRDAYSNESIMIRVHLREGKGREERCHDGDQDVAKSAILSGMGA
jgi:hypothetical protein